MSHNRHAILFIYSVESVCSLATSHQHKMMCTKSCYVGFFPDFFPLFLFISFTWTVQKILCQPNVFREFSHLTHVCMCANISSAQMQMQHFQVKRHTFILRIDYSRIAMLIKWREATFFNFFFQILDFTGTDVPFWSRLMNAIVIYLSAFALRQCKNSQWEFGAAFGCYNIKCWNVRKIVHDRWNIIIFLCVILKFINLSFVTGQNEEITAEKRDQPYCTIDAHAHTHTHERWLNEGTFCVCKWQCNKLKLLRECTWMQNTNKIRRQMTAKKKEHTPI